MDKIKLLSSAAALSLVANVFLVSGPTYAMDELETAGIGMPKAQERQTSDFSEDSEELDREFTQWDVGPTYRDLFFSKEEDFSEDASASTVPTAGGAGTTSSQKTDSSEDGKRGCVPGGAGVTSSQRVALEDSLPEIHTGALNLSEVTHSSENGSTPTAFAAEVIETASSQRVASLEDGAVYGGEDAGARVDRNHDRVVLLRNALSHYYAEMEKSLYEELLRVSELLYRDVHTIKPNTPDAHHPMYALWRKLETQYNILERDFNELGVTPVAPAVGLPGETSLREVSLTWGQEFAGKFGEEGSEVGAGLEYEALVSQRGRLQSAWNTYREITKKDMAQAFYNYILAHRTNDGQRKTQSIHLLNAVRANFSQKDNIFKKKYDQLISMITKTESKEESKRNGVGTGAGSAGAAGSA